MRTVGGVSLIARRGPRQGSVLFSLRAQSQQQLAHTLFPLGEMQKSDVRALAQNDWVCRSPIVRKARISVSAIIRRWWNPTRVRTSSVGGDVVDRSGKVLGQHSGIHGVTIGQRRGLGISASRPLYVVDIEEESKRVVVGTKEELGCKGLIAGNINWIESSRRRRDRSGSADPLSVTGDSVCCPENG